MIYRQIYQAFLGHCLPYEPDEPWSRIHAEVDLWTPPPSGVLAVMESLQDDYSDEDLLASRLAVEAGRAGWSSIPRLLGLRKSLLPCVLNRPNLPSTCLFGMAPYPGGCRSARPLKTALCRTRSRSQVHFLWRSPWRTLPCSGWQASRQRPQQA